MAPAVQYSHRLLGLPAFLTEGSHFLCPRPSGISAFPARFQLTTITAFRTPQGDALDPELQRTWTARIQPLPRMTRQTELPGPKPDS
jgi:hypothetical protein